MQKNNDKHVLVQSILNSMLAVIELYGLELMKRYPDDLLVHDKAVLDMAAVPGAKFAWMVGHCHTHIVPLGFHQKENESVEYMVNLSSEDRFYVISVGNTERFTMKELDRKSFAALSSTPVAYKRNGDVSGFCLTHNEQKVGYVELNLSRAVQNMKVDAKITPFIGISGHELAALQIWCSHACVELTRTLFFRSELSWGEPITLARAA